MVRLRLQFMAANNNANKALIENWNSKNVLNQDSSQNFNESRKEEVGSITPLIVLYFTLIMVLTFLVANVGSMYIARRELTNRVEDSLAIAAQELDEFRYYYAIPTGEDLINKFIDRVPGLSATNFELQGKGRRVPLDCGDAERTFRKSFQENQPSLFLSRKNRVLESEIVSFNCDGFQISAEVFEEQEIPFKLRLFNIDSFQHRIRASSASNYLS